MQIASFLLFFFASYQAERLDFEGGAVKKSGEAVRSAGTNEVVTGSRGDGLGCLYSERYHKIAESSLYKNKHQYN